MAITTFDTRGVVVAPITAEFFQLLDIDERSLSNIVYKENSTYIRQHWGPRTRKLNPYEQEIKDAEIHWIAKYGSMIAIGLVQVQRFEHEYKTVLTPRLTDRGREALHCMKQGYVYSYSDDRRCPVSTKEFWHHVFEHQPVITRPMIDLITKLPIGYFKSIHNELLRRKIKSHTDGEGNLLLLDDD